MDLQQTVQDLAEAWVAASTDTSFSRTQHLQVYGSAIHDEGDDGTEPSTSSETDLSANPIGSTSPPPGLPSGDSLASSHSRKRKQSSPQPRREGTDTSALPSARKADPPPAKRPVVKSADGKMLPVHCLVEMLDSLPGTPVEGAAEKSKDDEQEEDDGSEPKKKEGYAIVPSTLQLRDLVRVALSKLDYPPEKAKNATGVIQVRNWKPLPFSSITDNQQASVGQLFGDLLSHITLKISILPRDDGLLKDWTDQAVRCTVMELLKDFNQSKLAQICPLSQSMISYIANAKYKASISTEKCEEFGRWYQAFKMQQIKRPDQIIEQSSPKVCFHPVQEVPLLREWYRDSQHPPESRLVQYCNVLNSLTLRRGPKRPVELVHLKTWWKNERAKHRKQGQVAEGTSTPIKEEPY